MTMKSLKDNTTLKFFLFLGILAACWYLGRIFKIDIDTCQKFLLRYPLALSGVVFVFVYVVTTTFVWFGPKDILRVSSALFFGGFVSTVYVCIGELINAVVMFHLSRKLGRDYVYQKYRARSKEIDQMGRDPSFLGLIAWRVNPLIPFRLMDLGYGLTQVSFRKYLSSIIVITFIRVLWLQTILAGIGANLLSDFSAIQDYLFAHPHVIRLSMGYFLAVFIITIAAIINRKRRTYASAK